MFYLVGSRFFGTHREDSDYDFIAEDNETNRKICEDLGLSRLEPKIPVRYAGEPVDICLVPNVQPYIRARDEIARLPDLANLSKEERHNKIVTLVRKYRQELANGMVE